MICKQCNNPIQPPRSKFCSIYCGKKFHKVGYRQRHKEHINAYKRKWRKENKDKVRKYNRQYKGDAPTLATGRKQRIRNKLGNTCYRCGTETVEIHHIKPRRFGGTHDPHNLMLLCIQCHKRWHKMFDSKYWERESK